MSRKITIGFILLCCLSLPLYSQIEVYGIASQAFYNRSYDRTIDLDFQITDARAIGLGNAFVAIADNPSAILWNAAGLTQLTQLQASFLTQFNFDNRVYHEASHAGIRILSEPQPHFNFPAFAAVWPYRMGSRNLVVGVAYHDLIPLGSYFDEDQYYYGGGRVKEIKEATGGVRTLSAALAYPIIPQISVGLTYHYLFGANAYNLKIKSPYVDNRTYFQFEDEEESSGNFFKLGVLLKPVKWFSVGLTATPSWSYSVTEKSESYEVTNYDLDLGWQTVALVTAKDSLSVIKVEEPFSYQVGLTLRPISKLCLSGAYEFHNWQDSKLTRDGKPVTHSMMDVKSQRYGIEYRAGKDNFLVPLRIGYLIQDFPQRDQFFEGKYYGDQIQRHYLNLGIGLAWQHFEFDFAFRFGKSKVGWWLRPADYYNHRMFETEENYYQIFLNTTYKL